jgi:hypothetical protein
LPFQNKNSHFESIVKGATYLVNLQNIGFRFEETEKILVFLYQNPDSKNLWDF